MYFALTQYEVIMLLGKGSGRPPAMGSVAHRARQILIHGQRYNQRHQRGRTGKKNRHATYTDADADIGTAMALWQQFTTLSTTS